jgi:5'-3' exonuclease
MGIPKFFRWLTRRYPLILTKIEREEDCPPTGTYFFTYHFYYLIDNLYLDLNGIVHNCIHGNDSKKHEHISKLNDFEEVWANIIKAIDEIIHIIKPGK